MGLPARDKFSGSVERIVRTIRAFCPAREGQHSVEQFYAQYLLAGAIRNGDAHLKNFGLLYTPGKPPHLAPVYDMLTMAAYAPRDNDGDALDGMALTLGGTKRWPRSADLDILSHVCEVAPARREHWVRTLVQALSRTADAVIDFHMEHADNGFSGSGARLLELWSHGVRVMHSAAADELSAKAQAIGSVVKAPANRKPPGVARSKRRGIIGEV